MKSEKASVNSFSFDHSILLPGGIHRICDLKLWSPRMNPSQYSWNDSICCGVHVSGALAKAAGRFPEVNR
jgi:hypothetical protein